MRHRSSQAHSNAQARRRSYPLNPLRRTLALRYFRHLTFRGDTSERKCGGVRRTGRKSRKEGSRRRGRIDGKVECYIGFCTPTRTKMDLKKKKKKKVAFETAHEFSRPEGVQRVPSHVYEHYKNWCFHKIYVFTKKERIMLLECVPAVRQCQQI